MADGFGVPGYQTHYQQQAYPSTLPVYHQSPPQTYGGPPQSSPAYGTPQYAHSGLRQSAPPMPPPGGNYFAPSAAPPLGDDKFARIDNINHQMVRLQQELAGLRDNDHGLQGRQQEDEKNDIAQQMLRLTKVIEGLQSQVREKLGASGGIQPPIGIGTPALVPSAPIPQPQPQQAAPFAYPSNYAAPATSTFASQQPGVSFPAQGSHYTTMGASVPGAAYAQMQGATYPHMMHH